MQYPSKNSIFQSPFNASNSKCIVELIFFYLNNAPCKKEGEKMLRQENYGRGGG